MTTYPAELVALARACRAGADVGPALHDALVEAGYPTLARWCFSGRHTDSCLHNPQSCLTIGTIERGEALEPWEAKVRAYLAGAYLAGRERSAGADVS